MGVCQVCVAQSYQHHVSSFEYRGENAVDLGVKTLVTDFYDEKEKCARRVVDSSTTVVVLLGRRRRRESPSGVIIFTGDQMTKNVRVAVHKYSM